MPLATLPAASSRLLRAIALTSIVLSLALGASSAGAQTIPTDAKATCTVSSTQFSGWFQSGHPALNGIVNPANSVTFSNPAADCPFYQWSKQMFLWLTSPAPSLYGGGAHVMDSPVFYDVSPVIGGKRTLIRHVVGALRPIQVRAAQVGPHGLPVVVDTAGRLIEFRRATADETPMIRSSAGKLVPLASLTRDASLRVIPQDASGKVIALAPRSQVISKLPLAKRMPATLFRISGIPILLDSTGNVIETEEGQAGGDGVLLTQGNSLIYYVTMVNDVYAYFATMVAHQTLNTNLQFPTTQAQLNTLIAFAAQHNETFPDPNALAIEVKSSWVRASSLPNNGAGYITMEATVPTYTVSANNQTWTPTGGPEENVLLALVGMHIVGSAAGHPEMIWATFEHFGNTPNASFQYINTANQTKQVGQSTAGSWLFTAATATTPNFNVVRAMVDASNNDLIAVAVPPPTGASASNGVVPTDVLRIMAWGAQFNQKPNPLVASTAAANTEVISIHNSVKGFMPAGDIRNNYFMTGATWTEGGANPTGSFPGGNGVGTSQISNSTMETFQQSSGNSVPSVNCLDCHSNSVASTPSTSANVSVSHIFVDDNTGVRLIQPLF